MNRQKLAIVGLACILILIGCQHKENRYKLHGRVLEKDPASNEVTVDHQEIPGFMAAMTMPYEVKDAEAMREMQLNSRFLRHCCSASISAQDSGFTRRKLSVTTGSPTI